MKKHSPTPILLTCLIILLFSCHENSKRDTKIEYVSLDSINYKGIKIGQKITPYANIVDTGKLVLGSLRAYGIKNFEYLRIGEVSFENAVLYTRDQKISAIETGCDNISPTIIYTIC